jgi:hypothetical protein
VIPDEIATAVDRHQGEHRRQGHLRQKVEVRMTTAAETTKPGTTAQDMIARAAALDPLNVQTDAYVAFWKNASRIQAEMLRFMTSRLEKDLAHPVRLMNCKKPDEFIEAQMDFARTFFSDYAKEGQRVGELLRENGSGRAA